MKRIIGAFVGLGLLAVAGPSPAQVACTGRADLVAALDARFGERRVAVGLAANGTLIETFANAETGTWTITATGPGGPACLILTGDGWQADKATPGRGA